MTAKSSFKKAFLVTLTYPIQYPLPIFVYCCNPFYNKKQNNGNSKKDNKIKKILPHSQERIRQIPYLDVSGCWVVPGFFNIHIHGGNGYDFSDGNLESIRQVSIYLASTGVTSFLATCYWDSSK